MPLKFLLVAENPKKRRVVSFIKLTLIECPSNLSENVNEFST